MKVPGIISTAVLSLLLGAVAPALAGQDRPADQQDHAGQNPREQDQRRQHDHQQKPSADTQRQQGDQQQRDRHAYQQSRPDEQPRQAQRQEDRQQQQTRHAQRPGPDQQREARDSQDRQVQQRRADRGYDDRGHASHGDRQSAWEQHRAENWQSDHRTWQQRGGYNGYRVPQSRYRGYFGPQHGFRIAGLPFMTVGGYPRFQYSGYWISLVDPWPGEWGNGWYDDDDVYINYVDNGYYLFNRRHPGVGIAISISQ